MVQCLADASTTTFECFDIGYLLNHSNAPNQAYSYGFLMSMLQYQCGAGFYRKFQKELYTSEIFIFSVASDNWSCMQRIYNGKNATMYGCITDFVLNAQEDPKKVRKLKFLKLLFCKSKTKVNTEKHRVQLISVNLLIPTHYSISPRTNYFQIGDVPLISTVTNFFLLNIENWVTVFLKGAYIFCRLPSKKFWFVARARLKLFQA